MRKRLYLVLLLLAVGAVVIVVVARAFWEREPEYRGKRLSEWVGDLDWMSMVPNGLENTNNQLWIRNTQAMQAIRQIGTNALPYLLKWVRYEMPNWKVQVGRVLKDGMLWDQHVRADQAALALRALGPKIEAALPELSRMFKNGNEEVANRVANILPDVGIAGWPPLVQVLTNGPSERWRRVAVAYVVHSRGTNARPVIPALKCLLEDPDRGLCRFATNELLKIDPRALEGALDKCANEGFI